MKINISGSINIPDWAKSVAQDKYGQIWLFDCNIDDLEPDQCDHCIKEGTPWTSIDYIYNGGGIPIENWELRKFDLRTDKVAIFDGVLVKLCDIW